MPVYRIQYQIDHVGYNGPELTSRKSNHALLIEALSRVEAFAVAYDHLTKKGLAVTTNLFDPYKGKTIYGPIPEEEAERRRQLNHLDFTDDDLDQLAKLGVPVEKGGADTSIVGISEHRITASGAIVSAD